MKFGSAGRRRKAIALLALMVATSVAGGVELGAAIVNHPKTLLSPLQFQLNGKDPYIIRIPLAEGQTVTGTVRVDAGGAVTFSITLQQAVMQSTQVSGSYDYRFTAPSAGTYELYFTSDGVASVTVDAYSA